MRTRGAVTQAEFGDVADPTLGGLRAVHLDSGAVPLEQIREPVVRTPYRCTTQ